MAKVNVIIRDIKIRCGNYSVFFLDEEEIKRHSMLRLKHFIMIIIKAILFLFMVHSIAEYNNVEFFISIMFLVLVILLHFYYQKQLNELNFELIERTLLMRGYKIVYKNEKTGTISYTYNGQRNSLSVYKGYNSKWR